MEADLKLVPCKYGCEGCHYEHEIDCPWDEDHDACVVDGKNMIFINPSKDGKKEQNDE